MEELQVIYKYTWLSFISLENIKYYFILVISIGFEINRKIKYITVLM